MGECIFWPHEKSVGINKMLQSESRSGRWEEGILLGIREHSGEVTVGNAECVFKCRDFRQKAETERWDLEKLNELQRVPWETVPGESHDDTQI